MGRLAIWILAGMFLLCLAGSVLPDPEPKSNDAAGPQPSASPREPRADPTASPRKPRGESSASPRKPKAVTVPLTKDDTEPTYTVAKEATVTNSSRYIYGRADVAKFSATQDLNDVTRRRDHQFAGFVLMKDGRKVECKEDYLNRWWWDDESRSHREDIRMWCFGSVNIAEVVAVVVTSDLSP